MRKKVESGELTEEEAQAMMNGTTLRPPRMKEWMFPTPRNRDWKDTGKAVVKHSTRNTLPQNVARKDAKQWIKNGSALNPTWVEWLMGYPKGWTDLED